MFGIKRKNKATPVRETVELETFLDQLPEEAASKAKAAAARIDELEHAARRIGQADRHYSLMFVAAGVLVLLAAFMALGGAHLYSLGNFGFRDLAVLLMAGTFPALVLFYSLRMRERTRIDRQQFEIIETYFMPYGAIYLPPTPAREHGVVALTSDPQGWREPNRKDLKKAGWYW